MEPTLLKLVCCYLMLLSTRAEHEILYDSENAATPWTPISMPGKTKNGWQQKPGGYQTCDVDVIGAENWLVSPFIETKGAQLLDISIKYSIVSCDHLHHAKPEACRENVEVDYIVGDSQSEGPTSLGFDYSIMTQNMRQDGDPLVAALGSLEHNSATILHELSDEERSRNGIFLVIQDHGSCAEVARVTVKYYYCPEIVQAFARFPKTAASSGVYQIVNGECIENAESRSSQRTRSRAKCSGMGAWDTGSFDDLCSCKAGFEPIDGMCQQCGENMYKGKSGNMECQPCPHSSSTYSSSSYYRYGVAEGSTICKCDPNKHRVHESDPDLPCIGLPSNPRNSSYSLSWLKATISWLPPSIDGGDGVTPVNVFYSIQCQSCSLDNQVTFAPFRSNIQDTQVRVSGLKPNTKYVFRVFAENAVSQHFEDSQKSYSHVQFTTDQASYVRDLRVKEADSGWGTSGTFAVSWSKPSHFSVSKYCVRVISNDNNYRFFNVNNTYFKPIGLLPGTYRIDVSVYDCEGPFSPQVFAEVSEDGVLSQQRAQRMTLTIVLIALVFLLLLTILSIAMCFYHKRKDYKWTDASHLVEYPIHMSPASGAAPHHDPTNPGHLGIPIMGQGFTDPRLYDSPERMIDELKPYEIHPSLLSRPSGANFPLNGGKFRAVLGSENSKEGVIEVAVKCLSENCSEQQWRVFAIEAATMVQFNHPNVLMLQGVVTKSTTPMLVVENAELGPLDQVLAGNSGSFTPLLITHMLRGVACGLQYLSETGYVHKAIRGSSIQVTKSTVCKIAGFDVRAGLEEELAGTSTESDILEAMAPWCALEVLSSRKFSAASDVWSFGVLLWEALSMGEKPLPDLSSIEIYKALEQGHRLPMPVDCICPPVLYELMCACWHRDVLARPWISTIRETLEALIKSPAQMNSNNNYYTVTRSRDFIGANSPRQITTVQELLDELNLTNTYIELFEAHNYHFVDDLKSLSKDHLKTMGVTCKKHRNQIHKRLQRLKKESLRAERSVNKMQQHHLMSSHHMSPGRSPHHDPGAIYDMYPM